MIEEIKGQGFILRQVRAQEADVILRILSSQGEKISAFAKAGLKSKKRFGGALEPLTQINFRAKKKKDGDLYYLEETSVKYEFEKLHSDFERLMAATYFAELTEFVAQEGLENKELYNLLGAAWKALDMGLPISGVSRQWELKLLAVLGWLPEFKACAQCGSSGGILMLLPEQGHVLCPDCGTSAISITPKTQGLVSVLIGTSLLDNKLGDEDAHLLQKMTGSLFQSHLGNHRLRSAQFLGSLRGFQK